MTLRTKARLGIASGAVIEGYASSVLMGSTTPLLLGLTIACMAVVAVTILYWIRQLRS